MFTPPSLYQSYDQHLFSANARWDFTSGAHWHYQLSGAESYTRQHSFNPQQSFYVTDPDVFCPQTNPSAVPTAEFCDYTYDSLYNYNRAGFIAQATYVSRKFNATAGYQYEVENAYIYYLEQGHVRRNNQGGYLDFRYSPISRLSLDASVRVEANDYFGTRVVPRAGGSLALRYGKGLLGRHSSIARSTAKESRSLDSTRITAPTPVIPATSRSNPSPAKRGAPALIKNSPGIASRFPRIISPVAFITLSVSPSARLLAPCPGTPPPGCPFGYGSYFNTDEARARGTNIVAEARVTHWLFVSWQLHVRRQPDPEIS